ncbi:unnamed protein product, partial [Dibothriocephalus latus]
SSPASSLSSDEAPVSSESDEDLHPSSCGSLSSLTDDSSSTSQSDQLQLALRCSQPAGSKSTHHQHVHCAYHHNHHHHHHSQRQHQHRYQYDQEEHALFHAGTPVPPLVHIPTPLRLPRTQDHCNSLRTCLVPYSELKNCKLPFFGIACVPCDVFVFISPSHPPPSMYTSCVVSGEALCALLL